MAHALKFLLERTVICLDIWSFAQALLNFEPVGLSPVSSGSEKPKGKWYSEEHVRESHKYQHDRRHCASDHHRANDEPFDGRSIRTSRRLFFVVRFNPWRDNGAVVGGLSSGPIDWSTLHYQAPTRSSYSATSLLFFNGTGPWAGHGPSYAIDRYVRGVRGLVDRRVLSRSHTVRFASFVTVVELGELL